EHSEEKEEKGKAFKKSEERGKKKKSKKQNREEKTESTDHSSSSVEWVEAVPSQVPGKEKTWKVKDKSLEKECDSHAMQSKLLERELNPYWKDGGTGLTSENVYWQLLK
ncbi:hypothetical protein U0070_001354, partial [Myodes glareolus]